MSMNEVEVNVILKYQTYFDSAFWALTNEDSKACASEYFNLLNIDWKYNLVYQRIFINVCLELR